MYLQFSFFRITRNLAFFFLAFGMIACQGTKSLSSKEHRSLHQLVNASPVFGKSFTGFALYEPETAEWLYQQDADKYFTPASNTKILTLYTALEILGDTFPLLHYERRQDSLIFWGSGNPTFLDTFLSMEVDALAFLQAHDGPLFYTPANFTDKRFGSGWAWDDYGYYYQSEKAALPLYRNFVQFYQDTTKAEVRVWPKWFEKRVTLDTNLVNNGRPIILREEDNNQFRINAEAKSGADYQRWAPFRHQPDLVLGLLQDTLDRNIYYLPQFEKQKQQSLTTGRPDNVYRELMQQSDNFIAEQLLLMCSDKVFGEMNTTKLINYAQDSLFAQVPDRFEWVDGSGLSRYNLFTPRSVIYVLEKLYQKQTKEWLYDIFPTGGRDGTIGSWYGPKDGQASFVFAKTGTLRHRHCLSGYVETRSGKTLIFSFMHNNFTAGSSPMKQEMAKVLHWIHENL